MVDAIDIAAIVTIGGYIAAARVFHFKARRGFVFAGASLASTAIASMASQMAFAAVAAAVTFSLLICCVGHALWEYVLHRSHPGGNDDEATGQ